MQQKSDFFEGLVIGGIIGTAIGILYAPRDGKSSRESLCQNLGGTFCQKESDTVVTPENLESLLKKTKDAIETGISSLRSQLDTLKKQKETT